MFDMSTAMSRTPFLRPMRGAELSSDEAQMDGKGSSGLSVDVDSVGGKCLQ